MATVEEIDKAFAERDDFKTMMKSDPAKARAWKEQAYRLAGAGKPETSLATEQPVLGRLSGKEYVEKPNFPSIVPSQETAAGAGQFLKQSALPLAGAAAGTVAGAPFGPVGMGLAEGAGALGGEYLNQQLGITPESTSQLILSAGVPPAARTGMGVLQRLPKALPGASAALQEAGVETARQIPKQAIAAPPKPSSQLFDELAQAGNPNVPSSHVMKSAQELLVEQGHAKKSLQHAEIVKLADDFKDAKQMTIQEIKANAESLNKLIRDRTKDDVIRGAYKKLRGAIEEDLHAAAKASPQASQLRTAWTAYRREMAQDTLADVIETKGIKTVGEMQPQFNSNVVHDWIRKNKFFRESIDPTELKSIESTLKELSQIPNVPVKRGQPIGSGRRIGMIGLGAGIGGYAGGGVGAAVGAFAVDKGSELIARALMTETGRQALKKIVTANNGQFGQTEAALLSAYMTGGTGIGAELEQ